MSFHRGNRGNRANRGGGYRGRGDRGRGGREGGFTDATPTAPQLPLPFFEQKKVRDITLVDAAAEDIGRDSELKITNCQYVSSYNWINEKKATILVPGIPAKWTPPRKAAQLKRDQGVFYRDDNVLRGANYPTDPAIQAVLKLCPHLDTSAVDVFACGHTLGNILAFVQHEEQTFHFGVELIASTVFLVHKPNTPGGEILGLQGYGHNFSKAYTTWDPTTKNSTTHHRIIRYELNGLRCMLRFECDGYFPDKLSGVATNRVSDVSPDPDAPLRQPLDLTLTSPAPAPDVDVDLRSVGTIIPQQALFELKTRSDLKKPNFNRKQFIPRQWIRQQSNFVLAWHKMGVFHDIEINDTEAEVNDWEANNSTIIKRFCSVLNMLTATARDSRTKRFEVRRTEKGPLELWTEVAGWSALSPNLRSQWKKKDCAPKHAKSDPTSPGESEDDGGEAAAETNSSDSEDGFADYLKF